MQPRPRHPGLVRLLANYTADATLNFRNFKTWLVVSEARLIQQSKYYALAQARRLVEVDSLWLQDTYEREVGLLARGKDIPVKGARA